MRYWLRTFLPRQYRTGRHLNTCRGRNVRNFGLPVVHSKATVGGYWINTDEGKSWVYDAIEDRRYWVKRGGVPSDYLRQLTAERIILDEKGNQIWDLPPGRRNEALDDAVYGKGARDLVTTIRTRRRAIAEMRDQAIREGMR